MKWHHVEMGKVANVVSGYGFPREYQGLTDEEFPFFKVGDMNLPGNEKCMTTIANTISGATLKKLKAKAFPQGTIIFPKIGAAIATNKKRVLTQPSVVDNNVMGLIPKPHITSWYLYYWMLQFDLRSVSNIGPVPSMRKTEVERVSIPLPPPSEQRRVVEILDQADALRKKRAEADAKAARILPALFYRMFGDPATNPKGLVKKRLGDLIKVRSGNFLPAKNMDSSGHFPVYGGNGINGYHSEYMFEEPVIVLGRVGIYCGVVHYSEPNCWVTDNALYVAEQSKDLHPRYLAVALRIANLNQYAGRAGQPLISGGRIYPIEILVPPPEEQGKFASNITHLHRHENLRQNAGVHFEKLFSVLLHRAFSGDLTARWREAHMRELLQEMEQQAKSLNLRMES